MKPRDEEKKHRRRKNTENTPTSKSPTSPVSSPTQQLKHEDVIWSFYLCLDTPLAKTFMCSECKQLPKQTHAFTSPHGYIYCEYCIDHLIKTNKRCKIANKTITQKNPAIVIDNLVKTLRIKCPHQLQLNENMADVSQSKSQELKNDEIDEDDNIHIPPFPTYNINNMNDHEGVNENQIGLGIVGIAHANKQKNLLYCDWVGTIKDLPMHLQNECKFIKKNCPLYDLDATLCDVQNLYQHELKKHLERCSVTHWQHIVKQMNDIKSIQLSIVLKQELFGEKPVTNTPKTPRKTCTPSNNNIQTELQGKMDKMEKKLQDLETQNKTKDVVISVQNNKLNLIQKEIVHLKQIMQQQLSTNRIRYESDITSMFNHGNYALNAHKMQEMQQNLLQTQNKMDLISNEMKVKDNLISSLQSQMVAMNSMKQIQPQTISAVQQPGMVTPLSYDFTSHSDPVLLTSTSHSSFSPHRNPRHYQQHMYQSKSMAHIRMNDKIYRSDSNGNEDDMDDHDVPIVPTYRHRHRHKHKHKIMHQAQKCINSPTKKPVLSLYAVGYNEEGEIGLGHRSNLSSFTRLPFCDKYDIISIYYGSQSFFYLTASNELYCCGYNKYGQLGLGHTSEYIIKPTLNKYFKSEERFIDFISNSVCAYHTILKTQQNGNKLYAYGWNNNGQLGIGKKSFKESVPIELTADIFYNKNTGNIISISCGFHHTLFLTDAGKVICCGNNQYGQLGFGSNVSEVISPSFIEGLNLFKNIIGVQCGEYYSCCLDKNGFVFVFGRNDSGQLGLGNAIKNEECVYIPKILQYFKQNGIVITKIQCGDYHTLCLDSTGNVYAFGNNEYGQVGCGGLADENNNLPFINLPHLCKLPNNNKSRVIIDIDTGAYHSLLLSEDNEIYAFGNNDCNQCSTILNHKKINSPYWLKKKTEIKCLNNTNIIQIVAGYDCSFVVTNEE